MENKIKFDDLSIDEANLIFLALSKLPFEAVAGLFGKLQQQAQAQLKQQPPSAPPEIE